MNSGGSFVIVRRLLLALALVATTLALVAANPGAASAATAKDPVVIVPGFTTGPVVDLGYVPLIERLRGAGYDVTMLTYPDYGLGDIRDNSQRLANTIAAVGLGLLGTFISRRSSAGVLAVILVIPSMFLGADLLIMRFPELFPLHFFFQPMFAAIGAGYFNAAPELLYAINRIAITLLGVLAMLRLIFGMRNAESLLGVNRKSD